MAAPGKGYALFDLDHTLLPFDTQVLFCNYVLRREPWRRVFLLWFVPLAPLAVLKILSLGQMKRLFCSYLLRMPEVKLRAYARDFAEHVAAKWFYPEVVAELRRHQEAGRVTILNTASPRFYAEEIARVLGFDHCVPTEILVEDPMPLIPQMLGPNNKHESKISAMRPLLPEGFDPGKGEKLPDSYGYSDSSADLPLLNVCEHGVMIHPGPKLAHVGAERGWKTLLPPRPYRGKWGSRLSSLLQAFGCFQD